jgi:hypothetical protein
MFKSLGTDLYTGGPEHEARVLTTWQQCLLNGLQSVYRVAEMYITIIQLTDRTNG